MTVLEGPSLDVMLCVVFPRPPYPSSQSRPRLVSLPNPPSTGTDSQALHEHGFPTPTPIDCNRHCVLMSLVVGFPLHQIARLHNPRAVYDQMIDIVIRLAQCGLIHCDFNEFNAMVSAEEVVTMIDFPQMVSTSHPNAAMYAGHGCC